VEKIGLNYPEKIRAVPAPEHETKGGQDNFFWWGHDIWRVWEREPIKGAWGEAPSGVQGRAPGQGVWGQSPPEAESLFAFGRLIVQYFAVFLRFSADNFMTLPEIEITW